ncbi:MAG: hypothetical protein RL490_1436 [Pseudomonadota bacterium]|jgi:hypothetical protein
MTSQLHVDRMNAIIQCDLIRMERLRLVRDLGLPDCWIAAGFLRNAIWDDLHGRQPRQAYDDIDVIWFDPHRTDLMLDVQLEADLAQRDPSARWSVKNQARMHGRNQDVPYASAADAMCHWVESTAAVAVRIDAADQLQFSTPVGTADLFAMILRPGPRFLSEKHPVFVARITQKRWFERWPLLTLAD